MNKLSEINKQAALKASEALSKMVEGSIHVEIRGAEVRRIAELSPVIAPEEIVAGIYLSITGELNGASLLIFPKETAFSLSDLLVKREPGTTRKLTELDESALKEVGNIVSGNYFTVLSNMLGVKVIEGLPHFSFDMFGAVTSQILTEFAQDAEEALIVEIEFTFEPVTLRGYYLLLFKVEDFKAIVGRGI